MKTLLFIANAVSLIFIINFLVVSPSITGFAVAPVKFELDLASPLGIAVVFIVTTIALDIYFYRKSRHGVSSY